MAEQEQKEKQEKEQDCNKIEQKSLSFLLLFTVDKNKKQWR